MTNKIIAFSLVAVAVATLHSPAAWSARIKCWKNDEGVRECGNVVPPEYSQRERSEVSQQGVTVKSYARAKTAEEAAEEKRITAEAAEKKQREERIAREQAFKDRVLLDTFTTEEDLLLAHNGRLATIDSRIKHTVQIIADLEKKLATLRSQAANQERAGKPVSKELQDDISGRQRQIAENRGFIEKRNREEVELQAQYKKDLARYRALKKARR